MPETFNGLVSIERSGTTQATITLDPDSGDMVLGGNAVSADIQMQDGTGQVRIIIDADSNAIAFRNAAGDQIAVLGSNGNLTLGGPGSDGDVTMTDAGNVTRIRLDADAQRLRIFNESGQRIVSLGDNGNLTLGGPNHDGDISLRDRNSTTRITMDADNNRMRIYAEDGTRIVSLGSNGNLSLGGAGHDGDLIMHDAGNVQTVRISADSAALTLGSDSQDGDIVLKDSNGNDAIRLDGNQANLFMGGNGRDGDIALYPASENNPNNDFSRANIHLNADAGDIRLRNGDCAEDFSVQPAVPCAPGDVMVLGDDGLLVPCTRAFDSAVVGVISGADLYRPGIVLDRQDHLDHRHPIALVGKVCVRVTAQNGPIQIGDLLTPSDRPGHAMAAKGDARAYGAVIGKALATCAADTGLIPMIIALH
ncbi:MAG: hypothetical protein AAF601_12360 [Pseudomonadota bacterium]